MAASKPRTGRRGAGRQRAADATDIREALLTAARQLFTEQGFEATTIKQIAARAGANPAMIHYYFDDKAGLHAAVLKEAMAPILDGLERMTAQPAHLSPEDFFELYMGTLAAHPWLPRLVVREVLPDNGRLRAVFLEQIARRAARTIPALVRRSQSAGAFRPELDPLLVTVSLVSLAVFPFLAADLLRPALGLAYDKAFVAQLIGHTRGVFLHGTATAARR